MRVFGTAALGLALAVPLAMATAPAQAQSNDALGRDSASSMAGRTIRTIRMPTSAGAKTKRGGNRLSAMITGATTATGIPIMDIIGTGTTTMVIPITGIGTILITAGAGTS